MMDYAKQDKKGGAPLLEMLIVIIIILILSYLAWGTYFKKSFLRNQTGSSLSTQGVDTSSPNTIIDTATKNVDKLNQRIYERDKQIEKLER